MARQTAVEWLYEELTKIWYDKKSSQELLEQAKQMEKEQIINAWISSDNELQRIAAEKYYNETYNK